MEYYSAITKNKIFPFEMDLKSVIVSKMSDRERQIPYDFTYMWKLKTEQNKTETKWWLLGGKEWKDGWKMWRRQRSTNCQLYYSKSWECNVQHREYINNIIITMCGITHIYSIYHGDHCIRYMYISV